ncbi:hypothetical protein RJ55_03551 [Drechmeria coniospora]|nr:hypothetical protein RJ55_03551 [Drechmeria coniospora]
MYGVSLGSGKTVLINKNICPTAKNINAWGYNVIDNFLYGRAIPVGGSALPRLVRIGAGGSCEMLNDTLPFDTVIGDITPDGHYYTFSNPNWADVDLSNSKGARFGKVVQTGKAALSSIGDFGFADWAYVPNSGNYLWAFAATPAATQASTWLIKWDYVNHTWSKVRALGKMSNNQWGSIYATEDGYLYGSENKSGDIWRVKVNSDLPAQRVGPGPAASLNDGARCVNALNPIVGATQ